MLDDDIRSKHGTRQECIVGFGCWWGNGEGEDQECSALSFPPHVGSKRTPNAFIKADNRPGEEQCVPVNKGKQENLSLIETSCTKRLTGRGCGEEIGWELLKKKTFLARVWSRITSIQKPQKRTSEAQKMPLLIHK